MLCICIWVQFSQKLLEVLFFRVFGVNLQLKHRLLPTFLARSRIWHALTIAITQQSAQAHNLYKYKSINTKAIYLQLDSCWYSRLKCSKYNCQPVYNHIPVSTVKQNRPTEFKISLYGFYCHKTEWFHVTIWDPTTECRPYLLYLSKEHTSQHLKPTVLFFPFCKGIITWVLNLIC